MQARRLLSWSHAHRRAARLIVEAIAIGLALGLTLRLVRIVAGWYA